MIIVIASILIAIIWSYVSNYISTKKAAEEAQIQSASVITDLATIDASEFDEVVRTEFATAKAKAEENDSGNKFTALEVNLPSLELKSGETRYIFSSDTDKTNNWTISFSQLTTNYLRADIPKDDYLGNLTAINTALWKFNYVTAIQIAEKNGGQDWRETNGLDGIDAILKQNSAGILVWNIKYTNRQNTFSINIDAATGKIIN